MGTLEFTETTYTPKGTQTTYFYKDTAQTISAVESAIAPVGVAMWAGQTVPALVTGNIRSVEVYEDSNNDNVLEGIRQSIYLGTDAFPAVEDMVQGTAYIRLDATTLKAKATYTLPACDIVVVTD